MTITITFDKEVIQWILDIAEERLAELREFQNLSGKQSMDESLDNDNILAIQRTEKVIYTLKNLRTKK